MLDDVTDDREGALGEEFTRDGSSSRAIRTLPEAVAQATGTRLDWVVIGRVPTAPASVRTYFPWGRVLSKTLKKSRLGVTLLALGRSLYAPSDLALRADTADNL